MKALIMSDSHGWEKEVQLLVDRHKQEVDAIFHCGDSELTSDSGCLEAVTTVRGNCDFGDDFPEEVVEEVRDTRFLIAHGHLLNIKMTPTNLIERGNEEEADILCHGHSHIPVAMQENNKIIINPGSIRLPRQYPIGTYVIVETSEDEVDVTFLSMAGNKIEDLSKNFKKTS
ncbi:YfcE family phosphodiesterase [Salipaludibacillus neizhouensis]|uniref:Phosphoesterase n=1 Tax=Salipaludibacillus neizhouensis TaxID=885475 RepID=A0A3A9JZR0_9BACI|nr:metallophosphoesterase [Salipaludibacillus neizhouensis]RKL65967.1 YfcE family phosphodiesterase [Salipaludibacillus neizhouensis]